jgi:hypothetical protein
MTLTSLLPCSRVVSRAIAACALPGLLLAAGSLAAQSPAVQSPAVQSPAASSPNPAPPTSAAARPFPAARPADVASPDALIAALYDVISGPAGQARDWDRLRALFAPGARMVPVVARREGGFAAVQLSVDDYIRRSGEMLVQFGFTERELARRTERFGNVVHAWSSYEGRFTAPGAPRTEPLRGINSIQLTSDGTRWYVLSITWEAERSGLTIPAEYLKPTR